MPNYGKMSKEDFDRLLGVVMDEQQPSALLLVPGIYEAASEYFNDEVLDRWVSEHPTKYHIRSDRYAAHSEPVTLEEFERMCDDNGWDVPALRGVVLRDARRMVYLDTETGELVLEEVL